MQPGADVGHEASHGASDHGIGDQGTGHNGSDHSHAHSPEEETKGSVRWAERIKTIPTGIITIFVALVLVAIAGWVGNRFWAIGRLEEEIVRLKAAVEVKADKADLTHQGEKLDTKAEATPVENELNTNRQEIGGLRQSVATQNAGYNNSIGKYDTLLNKHEVEVASLRSQVATLCEKAAKLEVQDASNCADVKQLRDVRFAKLTEEIATLRERIASLEASLKSLESKK